MLHAHIRLQNHPIATYFQLSPSEIWLFLHQHDDCASRHVISQLLAVFNFLDISHGDGMLLACLNKSSPEETSLSLANCCVPAQVSSSHQVAKPHDSTFFRPSPLQMMLFLYHQSGYASCHDAERQRPPHGQDASETACTRQR